MMTVIVNGENIAFDKEMSLTEILKALDYQGESVAAALNGEFVPRSEFDQTTVRDGDTLELVAPMQGG